MSNKTHTLHNGDCLDVLGTLPAESIDVAIEDPPAGIAFMGRTWDNLSRYEPRTELGASIRASLQVLGLAKWEVGFVVFMVEVHVAKLRVLKSGAIVASWALPKTSHLAALALRIAGYEVLDYVTHLFGQGMAKAGDLGKKIDKALGAEREVVGEYVMPPDSTAPGLRPSDSMGYGSDLPQGVVGRPITAPATPEAEQWTDWSTQLAPGCEFWILARKPTKLTTVQQVLTHGCGALNIGACRVERGQRPAREHAEHAVQRGALHLTSGSRAVGETSLGSWPKNVVLTEGGNDCPVAEIDRQSGVQRDGVAVKRNLPDEGGKPGITAIHSGTQRSADQGFGGQGGASRYFNRFRIAYYAKASDRSVPGSDDPKANRHETHKHPELMRWLVRLLARPGNVVLDCFMGSGTTGVACAAEGVSFIGIEREPKHFAVAQARIEFAYAAENPEHYSPKRAKTKRG